MSTKFVGDQDFTVKCAGLPCVGGKPWSDETERWMQLKEQRVQSLKTCERFFGEQLQTQPA